MRPTWYAGGDTQYGEAWTMLHLPYTSMVLSFVVVGAVLSPRLSWVFLLGTLAAYFAGLGIGAHFLNQIPGMGSHYVRHWSGRALWAVGLSGVAVGVAIGIVGALVLRQPLLLVLVLGQGLCALGYPLAPLFGGVLHRDSVFAISWGSLPCLTGYYVQAGTLSTYSVIAAATFAVVALVEIRVSRYSRELRRRSRSEENAGNVHGEHYRRFDAYLQALSLGITLLALALLLGRLLVVG